MARKKPRKVHPQDRPRRSSEPPHAGPANLPQTAFGVHQGQLVEVKAPAWASAQAFWDVWAQTAELVTLSQHNPMPADRVRGQIAQLVQTEPDPERREPLFQLITLRANLAAQIIPALAEAQLVLIDSGRVQQLDPWEDMEQAYAYAARAQLPEPLSYLDLMDREGCGVVDGGPLGPVVITGCLAARDGDVLMLTPVGGPSDPTRLGTGGPFQPLGTVIYGPSSRRPQMAAPLDVYVDTDINKILLASELREQQLLGTVAGVTCAIGARVLRLLELVEQGALRPEPGDPTVRRRLARDGHRIPLRLR